MKSPFTGKEMKRVYEKRVWNFRGEQYEYNHASWLCGDSGEYFTDDESDMAGFLQVTNQYREKYGIPYTDEIVAARNRYGVSAAKMSLILGIGVNQYRLYEQGEVPSVSNGRMIRSIMNPEVMMGLLESSRNELSDSEYNKIANRLTELIGDKEAYRLDIYEKKRVFNADRGAQNGYAQLSLERLKNIMLYILERCEDVWCTKMNKLLFYIDFLAYRELGMAITGLSYRAIDYGPVPERWDKVYSEFPEVRQELKQAGDFAGSVLVPLGTSDKSMFSKAELQIVDTVCNHFAISTSRELSRLSHEEPAWIDYHESHAQIPFEAAFSLKAF